MIDDYVRAVGRNLRRIPTHERHAIQSEIHAHLSEDVQNRMAEGLSEDEAARAAIEAFGNPSDIGLAYGAPGEPGTLVNESTGQTVLRVAAATGRAAGKGAKGALKWTGIILASLLGTILVLLFMALLFTGTVLTVYQDDIREATPRPIYVYDEYWATEDAHTGIESDSFAINDQVKEFKFSLSVEQELGCASVTLTAPDGTAYDINGNGCEDDSFVSTYTQTGTWTIRYAYGAFSGDIEVLVLSFENA